MRRVFVILTLLAMMRGLRALKVATATELPILQPDVAPDADPLTLAAIGFVVLAAFAIAELGAKLQLPKVTGFIISGVVLGPYATKVLSAGVVSELRMFSTLALGLIATTAGVEIELKGLVRLLRTLAATIGLKIVLCFLLVGGTIVAGQLGFAVFGSLGTGETLALAIVLSALAIGTSPSVSLAILSETKARGRLADLVLSAAVVKDLVVIVTLAIAVAVARTLTVGGEVETSDLLHVAKELAASIAAGTILGGLLIVYIRYVKAEMLLFVAATILVVAEVSRHLQLELLLVFIVAGMVVRNFSTYQHELLRPLETVSLPVFIVFFTKAGADVDLRATATILPIALAACSARAIAFIVAARVGGRIGHESLPVQRLGWLAYLPQAGVTLGLLGLAESQLPELRALSTVGMAMVAINLLLGPITLRYALRAARETSEGDETEIIQTTGAHSATHSMVAEAVEAPPLRAIAQTVAQSATDLANSLVDTRIEPWLAVRLESIAKPLTNATTREQALAAVAHALATITANDPASDIEPILEAQHAWTRDFDDLPLELEVPLELRWRRVMKGDRWYAALRKRAAFVVDLLSLRIRDRRRTVPVRMTVRTLAEPMMASAIENAVTAWHRIEARQLQSLYQCSLGACSAQDCLLEIREEGSRELAALRAQLQAEIVIGNNRLGRELNRVGSPVFPAKRIRYSAVEPELLRCHDRIRQDGTGWRARRNAGANLVRLCNDVALVEGRLRKHIVESVLSAADEAFELLGNEINGLQRRVAQVADQARGLTAFDADSTERLRSETGALLPRPIQKRLRTVGLRLQRATSGSAVDALFRDAVAERPGVAAVVPAISQLVEATNPSRVPLVELDVEEAFERYLSAELMPEVEHLLGDLWSAFASARESISQCSATVESSVATALRESQDESVSPANLAARLDGANSALVSAAESAENISAQLRSELTGLIGGLGERLFDTLRGIASRKQTITQARSRRFQKVIQFVRRATASPFVDIWRALIGRESASGRLQHQYRLRAGTDRIDAAELRGHLQRRQTRIGDGLPPAYVSLFAPDPIRDPRLFVTHRDKLQHIVRAEHAWQQQPTSGNAALVTGAAGSGKTSLVNAARLKLSARRVVVVPDRLKAEDESLFSFISRELNCATGSAEAIESALSRGKTAVVIDDLQDWLRLGRDGLDELESLLALIFNTRQSTFWLVSSSSEALEAWEVGVNVRPAFATAVRLAPLGVGELDRIITVRQSLSDRQVIFPVSRWGQWIERLLGRSPRDSYLRNLATATQGNLRLVLTQWLSHATADTEGRVTLSPLGLQWGLPFLRQLSASQLAILGTLVRYGSRTADEIARSLAIPLAATSRELNFLVSAQLVQQCGSTGRWLTVPTLVRDDVAQALVEYGVLPGGRP